MEHDSKHHSSDRKTSKQVWALEISSRKHSVLTRMIYCDHSVRIYQDVEPNLPTWGKNTCVLVDTSSIITVLKNITIEGASYC